MLRLVSAALLQCCLSTDGRHTVFERTSIPFGWTKVGKAADSQQMSCVLAIRHANESEQALDNLFWQVSDPTHQNYQQFLTQKEIDKIVYSTFEDKTAVLEWLHGAGVHTATFTYRSDAVVISAKVSDMTKLFETEIFVFKHDSGHVILRNLGTFSIPAHLASVVEMVEGVSDFPSHRDNLNTDTRCAYTTETTTKMDIIPIVVPTSLSHLYGYRGVSISESVIQMPAEFDGLSAYEPADLTHFLGEFNLTDEKHPNKVGPFNATNPNMESTLDAQYLFAVGGRANNYYWTSDGWIFTFAHNLFNHDVTPHVVSISWAWAEDAQCDAMLGADCSVVGVDSATYVRRTNIELAKLGLKGISVFAASGDSGASGRTDYACKSDTLHPVFPASSPYVTSVGATQFDTAEMDLPNPPNVCTSGEFAGLCASKGTEVAVSVDVGFFLSGGGFSNVSSTPFYQRRAVADYIARQSHLPPASYWNRNGRAYPDVAAIGVGYLIYIDKYGGWFTTGGTSAATPVWAGVASRLVDLSLSKTGKPLGHLNPLLYLMHSLRPEAFNDVTSGNNSCSAFGCFATCKGFDASEGWDPVTGLGSPNYATMASFLSGLLDSLGQKRGAVIA